MTASVVGTTHLYGFAIWDDCYKLLGPANTGYYMNGLAANAWSVQPPFCFGFTSAAVTLTSQFGQLSAYTFVPTTLAVKLTSTAILLGTTQGAFNSITTWFSSTSVNHAAAGTGTPTTAPLMGSAATGAVLSATPSYKTSIVYPTATVAKGASSLAMSLAAATVLATLF